MDNKPEGNTDQIIHGGNPTTYVSSKEINISPNIKLIYSRHEFIAEWHTHIVINKMTTKSELQESWKKIKRANKWLHQIQLPSFFTLTFLTTQYLVYSKSQKSYMDQVKEMNLIALAYLFMASRSHLKNDVPWMGKQYFQSLLNIFQCDIKEIQDYYEDGLDMLKQKRLPWQLKDGPVTRDRVIGTTKKLKNMYKNSPNFTAQFIERKGPAVYSSMRFPYISWKIRKDFEEILKSKAQTNLVYSNLYNILKKLDEAEFIS